MANIKFLTKKVEKKVLEVAELADYLWQKGWAERNAGNISVNLTGLIDDEELLMESYPEYALNKTFPELGGGWFLVTGTGKRMRDLARKPLKNACIIRINEKGDSYRILSQKQRNLVDFRPTSELPTHLAVHELMVKKGSPNRAVVHTHPNELVAMTQIKQFQDEEMLNKTLWGMHPEAYVFVPQGAGLVPYLLPGSTEIADASLEKFKDHEVVIWEKHGVFAVGETASDAFDMIDILAKSAQIYLLTKQAGFEPEGLTSAQLQEIKDAFHS